MNIRILIIEIFYLLTVSLIVFFVMEMINPRIVLAYINLGWLFIPWLISAIAVLIFAEEE